VQIFLIFLRLGLTSFGGPIAHFVLFRREFVERRAWLDERQFGQLLTLAQALPGPGSSKLGFVIGLLRGGWPGALAAFAGFTLPSALLLFAFAAALPLLSGSTGQAALHGLKLVALSVVAFGLVGMSRALCPDAPRRAIALLAIALVLAIGQAWVQLLVVALGAAAGALACRSVRPAPAGEFALRYGRATGAALLALFVVLLIGLPLGAALQGGPLRYADAFFRTGALAFGGGHVVLPLLQDAVVKPGWIPSADFLAGYGAAQAVPGPMFALAAYLGARLPDIGGVAGAVIALLATFLPGFLLVSGVLPFWRDFAAHPVAARAIAGTSAAVVGLLAAALYDPLWLSAVHAPVDVLIAAAGWLVLARWQASALLVVALCVASSVAVSGF
jgi:chromate transporter